MVHKKYDCFLNNLPLFFTIYLSIYLFQVILFLDWLESIKKCNINWYDQATNLWKRVPDMRDDCRPVHVALLTDKLVFAFGSNSLTRTRSVQMIDLSSHFSWWVLMDNMIVDRTDFQVGVLNNRVYAVCYNNILLTLYYTLIYHIKSYYIIV